MQWTQIYDPLGHWWLSTLVAALPIIVLFGMLAGFKVKPHWCAIAGASTAVAVAIIFFKMPPALAAISRVFELREFFEWRGLGSIDHSGVRVRAAYARYDAERKFSLPGLKIADPKACQCGEVLKGVIKPWQCKVFGGACTPETPLGALMVSTEGACAAYYNYGGARVAERRRAAHPEAAE